MYSIHTVYVRPLLLHYKAAALYGYSSQSTPEAGTLFYALKYKSTTEPIGEVTIYSNDACIQLNTQTFWRAIVMFPLDCMLITH